MTVTRIKQLNFKIDDQLSDFRAILQLLDKQQICDPITVKAVPATISEMDGVFEKSSATFSATIDGPSRPKNVYLHHKGTFNFNNSGIKCIFNCKTS